MSQDTSYLVRQSEIENMNAQLRAKSTEIDNSKAGKPKIKRINRATLLGSIADTLKKTGNDEFDSRTI